MRKLVKWLCVSSLAIILLGVGSFAEQRSPGGAIIDRYAHSMEIRTLVSTDENLDVLTINSSSGSYSRQTSPGGGIID